MIVFRIGRRMLKVRYVDNSEYMIYQDVFNCGFSEDWLNSAGMIDWEEIEITLPEKPTYNIELYDKCYNILKDMDQMEVATLSYYVTKRDDRNYKLRDPKEIEYLPDIEDDYRKIVLNALTYLAITEPARIGLDDFLFKLGILLEAY